MITTIKNTAYTLLTALAFLLSANAVFAQGVNPLQYTVTPETPGPNETVRIDIAGVGTFLGDATIVWQKDGQTVLEGVGERSFSFTTNGLGVQTRIHVVITSSTHGRMERSFNFIPSVVHLLWEAETSVPPLYKSKALYTAGSQVKVIAFPSVVANGSTISSNNLSFQWSRNGNPVPSASGLGKNSFSFTGDQLRTNENVGVVIYFGGVRVGQSQITITSVPPQIALYSRDPLRGPIYDRALENSVTLTSNEITLQAQPYFFAKESISGNFTYDWRLSGNRITGPDSGRGILTLRQSGVGQGRASLTVSGQNTDPRQFTQTAQTILNILFGENSSAPSLF